MTPETLKAKGLIRSIRKDVKLLGVGELTKKLTITVHGASATAREKIEAAGGTLTLLKEPKVAEGEDTASAAPEEPSDEARPSRRRGDEPRPPRPSERRRRGRRRLLSWLANAWRVPELRRRVLFTALILALYRLGSWMPAPGVDSAHDPELLQRPGRHVLGLLNLFCGSALSRFSIFALGIMPYVTASIILQLLTVVIPKLEQLQKEGEAGYAKINQYTRYLTVVLAAAQAAGYAYLFKRAGRAARRTPAGSC